MYHGGNLNLSLNSENFEGHPFQKIILTKSTNQYNQLKKKMVEMATHLTKKFFSIQSTKMSYIHHFVTNFK